MKFSLEQLKDLPNQLEAFRAYYARLTEREQYMVLATIGGSCIFVMILIYTTFWGLTVRMAGKIETGRQSLSRMEDLKSRYQRTEQQVKKMELMIQRTPPNFQLLSRLEKLAQKSGVKIENANEKPGQNGNDIYKETLAALSVNKVSLRTLINLLYDIENGEELMRVSALKVKPDFQDPSQLNVNFTVSTFQSAKNP